MDHKEVSTYITSDVMTDAECPYDIHGIAYIQIHLCTIGSVPVDTSS